MNTSRLRWDLGIRKLARTEWRALLSRQYLRQDITAAVTVALVAIPLSLAIALASDVPPGAGLITAVVGGIVCGLTGGTPLAVSGPAAAMAVLTGSVVESHGMAGLAFVVLAAGAMQLLTGATGLGRFIRFVPVPVIAGFTAGIGAIIIIGQLPRLLGLRPPAESHVFDVVAHVGRYVHNASGAAVAISMSAAALSLLLPRWLPKVPAPLVAVVLPTVAVALLGTQVESIGAIPRSLPSPSLPGITPGGLGGLMTSAFMVYALASLETLLSSSAVDKMTRSRHDPDQELIGQGLGNLASAMFGGIPVTGVIVRSAVNAHAGAKTRRAAILHGLIVLAIVLAAGSLIERIPQAALAGVLLAVALRMLRPREFIALLSVSRTEAMVFLVTFLVIVLGDLILGVQVGLGAALLVAAVRLGQVRAYVTAHPRADHIRITIRGPVTFLSSTRMEALREELERVAPSNAVVMDVSEVTSLDVSGAEMLVQLWRQAESKGVRVAITGLAHPHGSMLLAADPDGRIGQALAVTDAEVSRILNPGDPARPIERLLAGVRRFQTVVRARRALFQKLGATQTPHTLFVSCSDSRVVPSLLTSTDPGELFQVRNIGNMVPAVGTDPTPAEGAAVEYALGRLGVREIVVLGHSGCGAMEAMLAGPDGVPPRVTQWLRSSESLLPRLPKGADVVTAARANVLLQLEHLETYPMVQTRMASGELQLHGWFYDIPSGQLSEWDPASGQWMTEPATP